MTNESGHYPTRDLVLILPEEEVKHKDSVIIIPESATSRERLAQVYGNIVAIGDVAFCYEDKNYGSHIRDKAVPGARILFAKYHGIVVEGLDGRQYRLVTDDAVAAFVDPKVQKAIES